MRFSKITPSEGASDEDAVGIKLEEYGLLNKSRLVASVPAYESNHMRHYLTDWK